MSISSNPLRFRRVTCDRFAAVWVVFVGLVAVHTQTLVGAIRVDTSLTAGHRGDALVNVNARLPVVLQAKAWPALAL